MSDRQRSWALWAAVLGSSMVFLDGTVVNVALPRIGEELPTPRLGVLEAQSYIYNGYLLTLSALLIVAGALTDRVGRRLMFQVGLVGFGLTSALCGLAPTMETLIGARLLQGAAGALLVPGSLAIITATFPDQEERGRAFGVWAGATTLVTILGPLLGGVLVDTLTWRAVFLINLPLAAWAWWMTRRGVAEGVDPEAERNLDWVGATLTALAVGGLTLGAIRGQEQRWEDPAAWVLLAVGAVTAVALPVWLRRAPHPLVPLELFRSRTFTVTNLSTLVIYGALYVVLYVMSIFLQGTLNYSASAAGVAIIPGLLFLALFSTKFGALAGRYGPRWFMAVGPAVMGLGVLWLARLPVTSDAWPLDATDPSSWVPPQGYLVDVLPGVVVFGLGVMLMVAPLTTALMASVPVHRSGVASAFNNAVSRVGPQLIGALVFVAMTLLFTSTLQADPSVPQEAIAASSPLNRPDPSLSPQVAEEVRSASRDAFSLAMLVSAGLLWLGAAINAVGIEDRVVTEAQAG